MITVDVDTSGLEEKIIRLSKFTRKTTGEVMRQQGRLLGVQLSRYTQPFGFGGDAKKQGEGAIARDVNRAFYVLPNELVTNPVPVQKGQYAGWLRLFTTKEGVTFAVQASNFRVKDSMQTLYRHHQSLRNRDGNVPKRAGWIDRQPRFVAVNMWVISQSQYDNYLPFIQKEAGFAKAGWATAIDSIGGTRGIPGWVTRHKGKAPGTVGDETDNAENPKLFLINEVNYTSQVLSESGKRGAVRDTEVRLAKSIQLALDHPPK